MDKTIKGTLKLNEEFGADIISKKKNREYRKLSKGITTGGYHIQDTKTGKDIGLMYLKPRNIYSIGKIPIRETHKETLEFVKKNYVAKYEFIGYEIIKAYSACDTYHQVPEDQVDCCDYHDVILADAQERADEADAYFSTV